MARKHEKFKKILSLYDSSKENEEEKEKNGILKQSDLLCQSAVKCMTERDWIGALVYLTEALISCEDESQKYDILIKRSDCFDRLQEFDKALEDAYEAIYFMGIKKVTIPYHRCLRYFVYLGEFVAADNFIRKHPDIFENTQAATKFLSDRQTITEALEFIKQNPADNEKCCDKISKALTIAPHSCELLVLKIKYLVGRMDPKYIAAAREAEQVLSKRCGKILKLTDSYQNFFDGNLEKCNFDAISKMLSLRIIDDMRANVQQIRSSIALASTHISAKRYQEAVVPLNYLLVNNKDISSKVALKIWTMLLNCFTKMEEQEEKIIQYASKIIDVDENNVKILWMRATAYCDIFEYEKALCDLDNLLKKSISDELQAQAFNLQEKVRKVLESETNKENIKSRTSEKQEAPESHKKEPKIKHENTKHSTNEKLAEDLNERAKALYTSCQYEKALLMYTDAINLCPKAEKYYTNRCACHMALGDYEKALPDAIKAVDVDPSSWKGYSRAINCFLILGNISQAKTFIEKMQNNIAVIDSVKFNEIPKVEKLQTHHQQIIKLMAEKNYLECLKQLENALKIATECKKYNFWKAHCLVMLGKFDDAQPIFSKYPNESYMMYLKGLNAFLNENFERAISHMKDALRIDPSFKEAQKCRSVAINLQKLYSQLSVHDGNYRRCIQIYTSIIDCDHDNATIKLKAFVGRCDLNYRLRQNAEAFDDASLALRLNIQDPSNEHCIKALMLRAKIHMINTEYEDAIIDCDEILRLTKKATDKMDAEKIKKDAKIKINRGTASNHYDVLKIPRSSPLSAVKEAFRTLSKQYHSDKHPNATPLEKKKLEKKFQEIKVAYDALKVQLEG